MLALFQSQGAPPWINALLWGFAFGTLFGLIPLCMGYLLGQPQLGRRGFVATVICGLIAGLYGVGPAAAGFGTRIYVAWRDARTESRNAVYPRDP